MKLQKNQCQSFTIPDCVCTRLL